MHKPLFKFTLTVAVITIFALPARAGEWQFEGVSRVVAIADVHGAYGAMVKALQAAEVVDADLAWAASDTHLVIVGDLLDRGPESRNAMDLLIRLEREAESNGGRVHVLIGNHEAMNLTGDLRYVSTAEYAAFEDEEKPEERERWFTAYAQDRAPHDQSPDAMRTVFHQKFPPGFFAHRRAFSSSGKYGQWLLSKPVIVVVNGTAFVHGGLSPMIEEIGLEGVNGNLHGEMVEYLDQLELLYNAGILLPTDGFHDHPTLLRRYLPAIDTSAEILQAIDAVKVLNESNLHALDGPLWYRGNVVCSELIEADKLAGSLQAIGATRVVIGHTPTPGRRVLERLDGQIIEIDTGMLHNYYGGSANALVIDDTGVSVINQDSETVVAPVRHPREVGSRPEGSLTYEQLETLLTTGSVIARRSDAADRDIVTVSDGTHTVESVFEKRKRRGFYPDVAAYRLDQLIRLEMVPVAVVREVDGVDGSLQFLPKNWIDEIKRQEDGRGGSAWCPLKEQWDAMFVFDVLIYNEGRNGPSILYSLDFWQLMLVGHNSAFSTNKGVPARLRSTPYTVGQAWQSAVAGLNEETLGQALSDVLDEKRIRALAARAAALAAGKD